MKLKLGEATLLGFLILKWSAVEAIKVLTIPPARLRLLRPYSYYKTAPPLNFSNYKLLFMY
jgi:hypothetical protein